MAELQMPEAELEVLACVHELGEAETSEIRERVSRTRPLTHASVTTLLRRLEAKKLIDRRKAAVGKAYVYFPITDRETTFQGVAGRMLQRVFRNDTVSMISSLFGAKPPSQKELRELRELVDELYVDGEDASEAPLSSQKVRSASSSAEKSPAKRSSTKAASKKRPSRRRS